MKRTQIAVRVVVAASLMFVLLVTALLASKAVGLLYGEGGCVAENWVQTVLTASFTFAAGMAVYTIAHTLMGTSPARPRALLTGRDEEWTS